MKHNKQQYSERFQGLIKASLIVTSSLKRKQVIKSIIELAREIVQSETASILLIDKKTNQLVFEFSTDLSQEQIKDIKVPFGEGIASYVAQYDKSLNIKDVKKDGRNKIL